MTEGISYFPLDVHLDDKIKLIEAEFRLKGFAVIVKLYQRIYGGFGYYSEWTNDVILLFSQEIGEGGDFVSEIVRAAVRRGIFDKELYDKYGILTSKGIQKRYFEAVSRRKQVNVKKEYLLVDVAQILKNVNILSENVNIKSENVNILEQSKVKKSIEKYSKAEESKSELSAAAEKCLHEYEKYVGLLTPTVIEGIDYYVQSGAEPEMIIRIIQYACEQNKRSWQYINAVIKGNFKDGILTLDSYNKHQAERAENIAKSKSGPQKSKFNNYVDTNKPDYSDFGEKILKEMMDGADEQHDGDRT